MKVHFGYNTNHEDDDYIENHYCGTYASELSEVSPLKQDITCKKCLKKYEIFKNNHNEEEEYICKQMGEISDFWKEELKTSKN